jgi:hypothetical protein
VNQDHQASSAPGAFPFATVTMAVERVVGLAGPYLAQLLDKAQPTPALLKALADELQKGIVNPRAVSHPELLDPDTYWNQALWPQAAAVVKHARHVLVEASQELHPSVLAAERDLTAWLDQHILERASAAARDPSAARDDAIDAIADRCEQLHNLVATVGHLTPTFDALTALRSDLDAQRHRKAEADVRRGDAAQLLPELDPITARRVLDESPEAVVTRRDAELRAMAPWRHQELAVFAHEQARRAVAADVDQMVERLTDPILDMGQRLVSNYDRVTAGTEQREAIS